MLAGARLEFELSASCVNVDFAGALRLIVDDAGIRLERASLKTADTLTRYWQGTVHHLRVLCDRSSVEIFINHGEGVMSSRYFPDHPARGTLRRCVRHHITLLVAAQLHDRIEVLAAGSKSL